MERDSILEGLFADPTLKAEKGFFLTSDNQAFSEGHKPDGVNHAKTLDDSTLDWFGRAKAEPVATEEGEETEEGETEVAKVVAPAKAKGKKRKTEEVATEEVSAVEVPAEEVSAVEVPTEDVPAVDAPAEGSDILQ
jgi:hypothetical protein